MYPELSAVPTNSNDLVLIGEFRFHSEASGVELRDSFHIQIEIDDAFPSVLPRVFETDQKIPLSFHHMNDRSLCLGSPLKLRYALGREYSLTDFVHKCVIPYLHGWLIQDKTGDLPFGELAHGDAGILDDYMRIFQVKSHQATMELLFLAGRPRRVANRRPCPCNSGLRVGKCHHSILNRLRKRVGRLWFRDEHRFRSNTVK